jgi:hypothetical protein
LLAHERHDFLRIARATYADRLRLQGTVAGTFHVLL